MKHFQSFVAMVWTMTVALLEPHVIILMATVTPMTNAALDSCADKTIARVEDLMTLTTAVTLV